MSDGMRDGIPPAKGGMVDTETSLYLRFEGVYHVVSAKHTTTNEQVVVCIDEKNCAILIRKHE